MSRSNRLYHAPAVDCYLTKLITCLMTMMMMMTTMLSTNILLR